MDLMGAERVRYLDIDQLKRDLKLVKSSTILIFDEADVMLYEHSDLLASLNQAKAKMLLLTATLGSSPFEEDFLKLTGILVMKPYLHWDEEPGEPEPKVLPGGIENLVGYTREVLLQNHAYVFVQDAEQKQKLVEMANELQNVQAVRVM